MPQTPQIMARLPFLGRLCDVYQSSRSNQFYFNGKEFFAGNEILRSKDKLDSEFNKFCKKYLQKIIQKEIARLRTKTILVPIKYKQGDKIFTKNENVSINSYLKKIGFSQNIPFEIGRSDKEWGINKLGKGKKEFSLFFNLNLIKYDSGEHIAYVVAHELCHVFHRDHGADFQQTLKRLYRKKQTSENFFKYGIGSVFKSSNKTSTANGSTLVLVIFLVAFGVFCYLLFWWISQNFFSQQQQYLF